MRTAPFLILETLGSPSIVLLWINAWNDMQPLVADLPRENRHAAYFAS